jgi:hypothetical protein
MSWRGTTEVCKEGGDRREDRREAVICERGRDDDAVERDVRGTLR